MKLPLATIINATRAHLSNAVANGLPDALRTMHALDQLPVEIDDRCLGEALLRAILGRSDDAPRIELNRVILTIPGASQRILSPDDAAEHPLIGSWIEDTLTAAVGAPLIAGARASNLAMGAPAYGVVQLHEVEGMVSGLASLSFLVEGAEVMAFAFYGDQAPNAPLAVTRAISASALFQIGADAGALSLPPAPVIHADPIRGFAAGSGMVH